MAAATSVGVGTILRLRRCGRSYRNIAAYLDRKGVPPPRAATWSAMTVRNVYQRETSESPNGTSTATRHGG